MLKLKLRYFGHLMRRADSFEKTLVLGKIEGRRRRGRQRMRWLAGITESMDMGLGRLWQLVMDSEAWRAVVHGVTKSWTRQSDRTEPSVPGSICSHFFAADSRNCGISYLGYSLVIMQLISPPDGLVSVRQLTGRGSEYLSIALEKLKILDLMTKLLLFCPIWMLSFASALSHFSN